MVYVLVFHSNLITTDNIYNNNKVDSLRPNEAYIRQ